MYCKQKHSLFRTSINNCKHIAECTYVLQTKAASLSTSTNDYKRITDRIGVLMFLSYYFAYIPIYIHTYIHTFRRLEQVSEELQSVSSSRTRAQVELNETLQRAKELELAVGKSSADLNDARMHVLVERKKVQEAHVREVEAKHMVEALERQRDDARSALAVVEMERDRAEELLNMQQE
jgi:hypothetical protein